MLPSNKTTMGGEVTKVGDRMLLIRDPKGHGRVKLITSGYRGGLGTYIRDPHH